MWCILWCILFWLQRHCLDVFLLSFHTSRNHSISILSLFKMVNYYNNYSIIFVIYSLYKTVTFVSEVKHVYPDNDRRKIHSCCTASRMVFVQNVLRKNIEVVRFDEARMSVKIELIHKSVLRCVFTRKHASSSCLCEWLCLHRSISSDESRTWAVPVSRWGIVIFRPRGSFYIQLKPSDEFDKSSTDVTYLASGRRSYFVAFLSSKIPNLYRLLFV